MIAPVVVSAEMLERQSQQLAEQLDNLGRSALRIKAERDALLRRNAQLKQLLARAEQFIGFEGDTDARESEDDLLVDLRAANGGAL